MAHIVDGMTGKCGDHDCPICFNPDQPAPDPPMKSVEQQMAARTQASRLWCQHCKALQKASGIDVECWYNPLDHGRDGAFCASNADAVTAIISVERNGIPLKRVVELWEQGKLVQLEEDQSWPEHGLDLNCGIVISDLGKRQVEDRMKGLGFELAIGES